MSEIIEHVKNFSIQVISSDNETEGILKEIESNDDVFHYNYSFEEDTAFIPEPITIQVKFPAINVKGVWKPTADFSKRIEADWELEKQESRISIDAPIISLFGGDDSNRFTIACSDTVSKIDLSVKYREEDDHFYANIHLFSEKSFPVSDYSVDIRFDFRTIPFYTAIKETASWWEKDHNHIPLATPPIALEPLYSSWYQFHQNLDERELIEECKTAKSIGFDALIIDDGWQTNDNNRGYDYTGDWENERFEDLKGLVDELHAIDMKVGLWFSVPFCGKKSNAYKRFKGKFLTENHRWAPVFDPRYPEVRAYLASIFENAVINWNLDGLKLDFIDDFKAYEDTSFDPEGKDVLSINKAVDLLLGDVKKRLAKINPEIFIEFRQKYTGPSMRKYGNMLRAFDCPGDYTMNKVRITDIKLLSGDTAVHSDMVTWHPEESLKVATLHYMNTLFGVPQLSIFLNRANESHLSMIEHYNLYWKKNRAVLLSDIFTPYSPLENYPVQSARMETKQIIGVYANQWITIDSALNEVDVLNVKFSENIILLGDNNPTHYKYRVLDCLGVEKESGEILLCDNCHLMIVPAGGMIQMKKLK